VLDSLRPSPCRWHIVPLILGLVLALPPAARPGDDDSQTEGEPTGAIDDQTTPPADTRTPGFRFHGYMRSGYGMGDGQSQEPFRAPGADAKYRLGNEAEAYIETTFRYGLAPEDEPEVFFDTVVTIAYVTPTIKTNAFETTTSLREAWALGRGVLGSQNDGTFWAGSRYYTRHDLHMSDFYYRDMSGFGGGIEDLPLGGWRLAVAWIGGSIDQLEPSGSPPPIDAFQFNKNTLDLRLYDIGLAGGTLGLAVDVSRFHGDTLRFPDADIVFLDNTGWAVAAIHEKALRHGRNKISLQYGTGAAFNFRSTLTAIPGRELRASNVVDLSNVWQLRAVEDLVLEGLGPISLQVGVVYQDLDNGGASGNRLRWFSVGTRPAWHFNRYFSLELEAGLDHTRLVDGPQGSLLKLTVAPQLTPRAGALERPSIRAYATWARWSDDFVGLVAPVTYGDTNRGWAVGVQLETWW